MKHLRSLLLPVAAALVVLLYMYLRPQLFPSADQPSATMDAAIPPVAESWPAWDVPKTKIVPIVSLGTPGVQIGFAQVTGPEKRVNDVKSVVQLDASFQRTARMMIFVPSSQFPGLNRVQGVAVTALLQYGLFQF